MCHIPSQFIYYFLIYVNKWGGKNLYVSLRRSKRKKNQSGTTYILLLHNININIIKFRMLE